MTALRTGIWFFPDADAIRTVALAERAESLGLDELWLGDEGVARDPFALLAAAAVRTHRLRLGIGVTNAYLRHPAVTAAAALTVHELSDGRAMLGLGPGGGIALDPLGIERRRPLARTREAVRIVRAVADGVATDGYAPPPRPFTGPSLPIWIGARGERFNRFASEAVDGAFLAGIPAPLLPVAAGWAHSHRRIQLAIYVTAVFDPGQLEAVRPRLIFSLLDAPPLTRERLGLAEEAVREAAAALAEGRPQPARRLISDAVLDQIVLHGRPEEVGHRLRELVAPLQPASIGLSLLSGELERDLERAAHALAVARKPRTEVAA
jgi:5,10-methylenetetrahydromethanopterin reductase